MIGTRITGTGIHNKNRKLECGGSSITGIQSQEYSDNISYTEEKFNEVVLLSWILEEQIYISPSTSIKIS